MFINPVLTGIYWRSNEDKEYSPPWIKLGAIKHHSATATWLVKKTCTKAWVWLLFFILFWRECFTWRHTGNMVNEPALTFWIFPLDYSHYFLGSSNFLLYITVSLAESRLLHLTLHCGPTLFWDALSRPECKQCSEKHTDSCGKCITCKFLTTPIKCVIGNCLFEEHVKPNNHHFHLSECSRNKQSVFGQGRVDVLGCS